MRDVVATVSKLVVDAGLIVLVSFTSPFRSERQIARSMVGEERFSRCLLVPQVVAVLS